MRQVTAIFRAQWCASQCVHIPVHPGLYNFGKYFLSTCCILYTIYCLGCCELDEMINPPFFSVCCETKVSIQLAQHTDWKQKVTKVTKFAYQHLLSTSICSVQCFCEKKIHEKKHNLQFTDSYMPDYFHWLASNVTLTARLVTNSLDENVLNLI